MKDEKTKSTTEPEKNNLSENWPEENVQELLDYIEENGVYIRE